MDNKKYKDLSFKEKIAVISAIASFIIGWGLTVAAFYTKPLGEVHSSVEWILGQALIYTASVLGIGMYFSSETVKMRQEIKKFVDKEVRQYETKDNDSIDCGTFD